MLEAIKTSSFRVKWNLREVHAVTQWKDDCVYRTRSLGVISCTPEYADFLRSISRNIIVGPVSTRISRQLV